MGATPAMHVLVLAAHDAARIDALRGVVLHALQATAPGTELVDSLHQTPEQPLADNQLLVWRDHRCSASVATLIHVSSDQSPRPESPLESAPDPPLPLANNSSPSDGDAAATAQMIKRIHKRDRKIKTLAVEIDGLNAQLADALERAKFVESEQEQFFEDVQHMKEAYDRLHSSHQKLLWEYLPAKDPDMRAIPRLSRQIDDGEGAVGPYQLFEVLGYGQYATVYASHHADHPHEQLAVKAIDKEKLIDLVALHRVNSEITALQDAAIRHPGLLACRDVVHTHRHIYVVTERGGKDLFEFFGPHERGVAEETTKALMLRVALAVQTLHRHNYCHRDLKPENILYAPDHESPAHTVKLVDFGLCAKATSPQDAMLRDFCGSPGFFAPEILVGDRYDGRQADVWSLGCILLELIIGNERFVTMWMAMYELETLKDPARFQALVQSTLEATRAFCHSDDWTYSVTLRSLLLGLLREDPQERLSVDHMLAHQWFDDVLHRREPLPSAGTPRAASPATLSPCRSKLTLPTAASSFTEGVPTHESAADRHSGSPVRRPASAENEASTLSSPHVSVLLSAAPPFPSPPKTPIAKVSLPSLSPEKPTTARSPDKSFAKRSASHLTTPSSSSSQRDDHHDGLS